MAMVPDWEDAITGHHFHVQGREHGDGLEKLEIVEKNKINLTSNYRFNKVPSTQLKKKTKKKTEYETVFRHFIKTLKTHSL